MKKKIIIVLMALLLMCSLIACGEESSSTDNSDTSGGEVSTLVPETPTPVEDTVEKATDIDTIEEDQQTEEAQEPESEPEDEQKYVEVIGDTVRIRSSISTESNDNIIGMADKGDKFVKTGDEEDWSKISFDGEDGFIKSEFLKDISKEEYDTKEVATEKAAQEETKSTPQTESTNSNNEATSKQQQDDSAAQQQAALLAQQQQQQALLAQQQEAAALLAQQQAATQSSANTDSSGGSGTWENTQLSASGTVYITPTGKRYHYDKDCAGPNAIPKNISEVSGYSPCKTCVLQ